MADCYFHNDSANAAKFVLKMVSEAPFPIRSFRTDNGSEFKGYFDLAIEKMKQTKHVWSYPRSPKTNGYVERFNWTIQDEFIDYEIDVVEENPTLFDQKLKKWLNYYNTIRPHQSLSYKTPIQQLQLLTTRNYVCLKCP